MWNPKQDLQQLTNSLRPRAAFREDSDWAEWREGLADRLRLLLGGFPQQAAALDARLLETQEYEDYTRERVEITTYEGVRMPIYVLIPRHAKGRRPAVVALHGHGYGSREIVGLEPDGSDRQGDPGLHKDFALELVKRGFIVAAPELLGFGDRRMDEDKAAGPRQSSCYQIAVHLLMAGQTIAGCRVYETMRVIDYLQTRLDASPSAIGCMGISGGGLVAAFTAALDERIQATVISGYANTFQESILTRAHCLDNYIPGIGLEMDMPDIIGLIAPRPLLIEAGDKDEVFPLEGAKQALKQLELIYSSAGARDHLAVDFFDGGHEISGLIAYEWLRKLEKEEQEEAYG